MAAHEAGDAVLAVNNTGNAGFGDGHLNTLFWPQMKLLGTLFWLEMLVMKLSWLFLLQMHKNAVLAADEAGDAGDEAYHGFLLQMKIKMMF